MATIFVGGLSDSVTNEHLFEQFEKFGTVSEVRVIKERDTEKPRGFAFVKFESSCDAEDAMSASDGIVIEGQAIRCVPARPYGDRGGDRGGSCGFRGSPRGGGYRGSPRGGGYRGSPRGRGFRGSPRGGFRGSPRGNSCEYSRENSRSDYDRETPRGEYRGNPRGEYRENPRSDYRESPRVEYQERSPRGGSIGSPRGRYRGSPRGFRGSPREFVRVEREQARMYRQHEESDEFERRENMMPDRREYRSDDRHGFAGSRERRSYGRDF